ncbi:MAG: Asp23/Gls24 family envelope stress response protein [Anaerovoracaceae bacterium]
MNQTGRQTDSSIKISDEVIAVCAVNATLKTEGVANLSGGISNTLSKNILGKELTSKGVKVNQTDEGIEIDVHIIVKYLAKIPAVAWDIQENVKKEVQSMTELKVAAVNIHVEGVEIPSEEDLKND